MSNHRGGGGLGTVTCHILRIFPTFFQIVQAPWRCVRLSHNTKGVQAQGRGDQVPGEVHYWGVGFISGPIPAPPSYPDRPRPRAGGGPPTGDAVCRRHGRGEAGEGWERPVGRMLNPGCV